MDENDCDGGWPGDGGGSDDLADFNANEANDYREEGRDWSGDDSTTDAGEEPEDSHLEMTYEDSVSGGGDE